MHPKLIRPAEFEWNNRTWVRLDEVAQAVDWSIEQVWEVCKQFYSESAPQTLACWLDGPEAKERKLDEDPKALYRVMVPRAGLRILFTRLGTTLEK